MNSQQIAIVLTDGRQTKTGGYTPLEVASQGIKDKCVVVYSIGIGAMVKVEELRQISSSDDNAFTFSGFIELADVVKPLVEKFCPSPSAVGNTKFPVGCEATTINPVIRPCTNRP